MNAPGKGLLKFVSILFIVFGAIALVVSILAMSVAIAAVDYLGDIGIIAVAAVIIMLIVSVLELVLGIVGLKKSGDPAKGGFFITTGIILCVLALASLILGIAAGSFDVTSLIGFILPVLYIVGGSMNKKALA